MKYFFTLLISLFVLSFNPCLAQQTANTGDIFAEKQEGNGLRADYYNGPEFNEKVLSRMEEEIDFYFYKESPAPGVNPENYSIRYTGKVYAPCR